MSIRASLRRHPHVVGYTLVALLATTGTASAAGHLHIRSRDIVNGQVKTKDLANSAATGAKLADGSVTGAKLADDSVTGAKVPENALTGEDILESSLTNVANSLKLGGLPASAYLRSRVVFSPGTATTIEPGECLQVLATGGALNAADAGKVVTGYITDQGGVNPPPSINNATIFVAGTVFKTIQGGAIGFVGVCNPTSQGKELPAGWKLIGSVKP
jgi:hypothetical protein